MGYRSQVGLVVPREHRLDSSVVSAPLVPPVCYRKAHSFNLLKGGSKSETVKHRTVTPVGARAAVQVSAKVGHCWKHLLSCPLDTDPILNYCKKKSVIIRSGRLT